MRNKELTELLRQPRYEVLPTKDIERKVLDSVPKDVKLTVTVSPTKGVHATIDQAVRFAEHGYSVVPHITARQVRDEVELKEIVDRLVGAGIDDVFVPAGDAAQPAGKYEGSLGVLADLHTMGRPFANVGITGYPESHPSIDDDVVVQAMWDKRMHATYIVSNMCFNPKVITAWMRRVRRRGVTLPVMLGLPGPVDRTKLLTMATKIGVGDSTRFLAKNGSLFVRLATPGAYSPERLLLRTPSEAGVAGVHVFTFNQAAETEQWRQRMLTAG